MIKNLFYLTNRLGSAGYKSKSIPFLEAFGVYLLKPVQKLRRGCTFVYFLLRYACLMYFFYKGA